MNFTKIVNPGKVPCGKLNRQMFAEINFIDGNLTIHGVIGPKSNGNAFGAAGQIHEELDRVIPGAGWDAEAVKKFQKIWKRWHLNDMTAGSPKQEAFVREMEEAFDGNVSFKDAVKALKKAGIYEDNTFIREGKPYRYGTAWLKEEVPADVAEWLWNLPNSAVTPAWV